jgi:hypothetical protein
MVSALGAVSAWRVTKGIYRFDPTLGKALVDTPIKGDMPIEVLFRMPEWCVYIETTGLIEGVEGFFAHMEKDANTGGVELRLLVDSGPIESPLLQPVPIHLFPGGNLEESIRAFLRVAEDRVGVSDLFPMDQVASYYTKMTEPMVSLLLYLCSEEPDYGERTPPIHPVKAKLKHAADKPMAWDVGVRIGAILRKAEAEPATTTEPAIESGTLETKEHGTHASPRPHVRRAHWHSFWVGPKGNQRPRLKWLSPMLVGGAENVATIKQVK